MLKSYAFWTALNDLAATGVQARIACSAKSPSASENVFAKKFINHRILQNLCALTNVLHYITL